MSRPLLVLLLTAGIFLGVLGPVWLWLPPSNQELLANYAKAQDYANNAAAAGGLPWWSPNFMMGGSLAPQSLWALTDVGVYLGALIGGQSPGLKLAALAFLLLCPVTMYRFVRQLCPQEPWAAVACGLAYLFSPPVLIRLGGVEHVNMVLSMALMPEAFRGVLVYLERRTILSALQCAVAMSLLVMAYAKPAVLLMPMLFVFAFFIWGARARFSVPHWKTFLVAGGAFFLLAILPNIPTLREMQFAAGFTFGPFEGWQNFYSSKSAVSWLDRMGFFSGTEKSLQNQTNTPSTYVGYAVVLCAAIVFFLRRRQAWNTQTAVMFRLFVALSLLAQWLGYGVHNAIGAHLAFLKNSSAAPDFAIAVSWGLLVLQGVVIFLITPGSLPGRPWWSTLAVLVYFLVPGFRLIEKMPFYGDIRAPHDFFGIAGAFCVAVAGGLAAFLVITQIPRIWKVPVAVVLILVAGVDGAGVVPNFFRSVLDKETFDDFLAAQNFLKTSSLPGRVMPYSGRYFYLLTPLLSGRGLATEAFNNYLTLRGIAELQTAAHASKSAQATFFNVAGISHVLIDRKDPDTPREMQELLRAMLPVAYENPHFTILENRDALAPAAWAKSFVMQAPSENDTGVIALEAGSRGLAVIGERTVFGDNEGLVEKGGRASDTIKKIDSRQFSRLGPQEISVDPPAETGWLLIPEAFHPDWQAFQNGKSLEVARAFCGLIGVRLLGSTDPVRLIFRPPWWFPVCIGLSIVAWLATLGLLVAANLRWLPEPVRLFLAGPSEPGIASPKLTASPGLADKVRRIVVIIPTYNEAVGIRSILEKTLSVLPNIEILVIDDSSPDNTAEIVRGIPGSRIHLRKRPGKLGLGSAYREGFQWALEMKFDVCIEMDADFSHNPEEIPKLIEAIENGADAAIGSRYLGGVRVINWPQDRLLLSMGASRFVRALTGLPLTDITSGFKALRTSSLQNLDWKLFKAEGYGFQVELHYFLWKSGARIVEVPIVFTERREGKTKMTIGIAAEALRRVLQLAIKGK